VRRMTTMAGTDRMRRRVRTFGAFSFMKEDYTIARPICSIRTPLKNLALIDSITRKEMLPPPKRRKLPAGREKNPICDLRKGSKIKPSGRSFGKSGNAFLPLADSMAPRHDGAAVLEKAPVYGYS
jgi:hypothetical protein